MASRRSLHLQRQPSNLSSSSSSPPSSSPLRNAESRTGDVNPAGSSSSSSSGGSGSLLERVNNTSTSRRILPPLPPQGPSPPGRSSSPRYHSHSASVATSASTSAPASNLSRNNISSTPSNLSTPSRRPLSPSIGNESWLSNIDDGWEELDVISDEDFFSSEPDFDDADELLLAVPFNASPSSTYPFLTTHQQSPAELDFHASQASTFIQAATSASASASGLSLGPGTTTLHQEAAPPSSRRINDGLFFPNLNFFSPPSRSTTQLTNSTFLSNDILNDNFFFQTPDTSFSDTMPTTRSRADPASPAGHQGSTPNKRRRTTPGAELRPASRRTTAGTAAAVRDTNALDSDDDLFGESPPRPGTGVDSKHEDYATIDLTEATEVPEELKKPEVDNRVKLSAFQCVICMDDVTNLTITHCGHMYCAQCLHSSLNVEATRGKCPMCRTKIDMRPRSDYKAGTKGFWHLELKLMTATRKGKRKADSLS